MPYVDPLFSNFDGTISHMADINIQMSSENDSDDDTSTFVSGNINGSITNNNYKKKSYFAHLKPNFLEGIRCILTQEDVDKFVTMMDYFLCGIKQKYECFTKDLSDIRLY